MLLGWSTPLRAYGLTQSGGFPALRNWPFLSRLAQNLQLLQIFLFCFDDKFAVFTPLKRRKN
jgi:hypothetical protein